METPTSQGRPRMPRWGSAEHTHGAPGTPAAAKRRDRRPPGSRVGGGAAKRPHLRARPPPARHTSCAYRYPHQTAAEGRLVTSLCSRGVSKAAPGPVRHPDEDAEPRFLRVPFAGTAAWAGERGSARLPPCQGGLSRPRVPARRTSRAGTVTQRQPLTFSWIQSAEPRCLTPWAARGRAATSSSRWRVSMTRRSPPPAISETVCAPAPLAASGHEPGNARPSPSPFSTLGSTAPASPSPPGPLPTALRRPRTQLSSAHPRPSHPGGLGCPGRQKLRNGGTGAGHFLVLERRDREEAFFMIPRAV